MVSNHVIQSPPPPPPHSTFRAPPPAPPPDVRSDRERSCKVSVSLGRPIQLRRTHDSRPLRSRGARWALPLTISRELLRAHAGIEGVPSIEPPSVPKTSATNTTVFRCPRERSAEPRWKHILRRFILLCFSPFAWYRRRRRGCCWWWWYCC